MGTTTHSGEWAVRHEGFRRDCECKERAETAVRGLFATQTKLIGHWHGGIFVRGHDGASTPCQEFSLHTVAENGNGKEKQVEKQVRKKKYFWTRLQPPPPHVTRGRSGSTKGPARCSPRSQGGTDRRRTQRVSRTLPAFSCCPRAHTLRDVALHLAGHVKKKNINRAIGILSLRNFDPETRTLRKHAAGAGAAAAAANGHDQDDTIEKNVQGLAQAVLAADEARQAAELVSVLGKIPHSLYYALDTCGPSKGLTTKYLPHLPSSNSCPWTGPIEYCTQTHELGPEAGPGEETPTS